MNIWFLISKFIKKTHIPAIRNSQIDETARISSASHLVEVKMGKYSYVGNNCTVIEAEIGSFCSIADNTIIGGASHPIDWVSTSPVFHEGKNIMRKNFSTHPYKPSKKTFIGNDVWIGNNCLIKSGINIETGAVIGMGSVVTKNVGAYEIWAGNPARLIRKRFNEDTIEKLLQSQWWKWDENSILDKARHFNDIDKFINIQIGD